MDTIVKKGYLSCLLRGTGPAFQVDAKGVETEENAGEVDEENKVWQERVYVLRLGEPGKKEAARLDFYHDEAQFKGNSSVWKTIFVEHMASIQLTRDQEKSHTFEIKERDGKTHLFAGESAKDMSEWVESVQRVRTQSAHTSKSSGTLPSGASPELNMLNDNDIYESADDPTPFDVEVTATDAAERIGVVGDHVLLVGTSTLGIAKTANHKILCKWPYKYIRRYGRSRTNFTFEAGRRCTTGEGLFILNTTEGNRVFHTVQDNVQAMRDDSPSPKLPTHEKHDKDKNYVVSKKPGPVLTPMNRGPLPANNKFKKDLENKLSSQGLKSNTPDNRDTDKKENIERKSHIDPTGTFERQPVGDANDDFHDYALYEITAVSPPCPPAQRNSSVQLPAPPKITKQDSEEEDDYALYEKDVGAQPPAPKSNGKASSGYEVATLDSHELYAQAMEPQKDAWKTFGRQEDSVHEEIYQETGESTSGEETAKEGHMSRICEEVNRKVTMDDVETDGDVYYDHIDLKHNKNKPKVPVKPLDHTYGELESTRNLQKKATNSNYAEVKKKGNKKR